MGRRTGRHLSPAALGRLAGAVASVLAVASPLLVGSSCSKDNKLTLDLTVEPETTPTMLTHDVSTLISDSGITRYHIKAPVWYVFGEAKSPRWTFPDGLYVEKFDDAMKQEATIECDSATYFEQQKLWRLDGNVRIRNVQNEKFLTEQLFWDQRYQKVYSDSFIHIERSDRIIEGYGFTSNDRMTDYVVNRVSGIFPVSQFVNRDSTSGGMSRRETPEPEAPTASTADLPEPVATGAPTAPAAVHRPDTAEMARRRQAARLRRQQRLEQRDSAAVKNENETDQ
ncbi:MAG: LPS export ABC transporter periplasmic protein LptC [Clostridium sp.]|nr:LPS export ABC transporter periplasmic protein LptC [Clostridium sp.]